MGFLSPAARIVMRAAAAAMAPPPPPDITRWCEENIVFDARAPMPGPFRIDRFPFLREIHAVLSPEHACREVTLMKSAQIGGTVSIVQPTLGAWHEYGPLDSLVVHPTAASASEWVDYKWNPMRRQAPSLKRIFGDGRGANKDNGSSQETVNRDGSLKIASAGSPDDLAGTSRRLVILDDLAKFEMNDKGDPEMQALSRASAFEDAKIFRNSTPLVEGTCRITKAFGRSDQRRYHVPCPHCGQEAPLTWANFKANIDPERLHAAHFTCESCGCVIQHADKLKILGLGQWVAANPRGDHPGFQIWRAYAPQRDWASIAVEYAQVMGWTRLTVSQASEESLQAQVTAETEQTFYNDVLGLPYQQASKGPDWEALRNRAELAAPGTVLDRGVVPARGVILTAGADCQDDRIEVHVVAFGANFQRWVVDYRVIPHPISSDEGRAALDALLKTTWRTARGLRIALDMMAVDAGAYTTDVWAWGKRHPWNRVILVKGGNAQNGPVMKPMYDDRRNDGSVRKASKRGWLLNVSQLKAEFYSWLAKLDPIERGYTAFPAGMGDEYYRQVSSEVRVLRKATSGVMTSAWVLVEPSRRNEALDTMNYAEAAARRKGWASMTEEEWAVLEAERGGAVPEVQADLFEAAVAVVPAVGAAVSPPAPLAAPVPEDDWIKRKREDWIS